MTFGSLFSGIGGIDVGLELAGMVCAWQVENDPFCQLGELGDPPTIAPGVFEEQPPVTEPAPGQEPPTSKLETVPPTAKPPGDSPISPDGDQSISVTFGESASPPNRLAGPSPYFHWSHIGQTKS